MFRHSSGFHSGAARLCSTKLFSDAPRIGNEIDATGGIEVRKKAHDSQAFLKPHEVVVPIISSGTLRN